jgi:parallel beta-helix repeat protein
MRMSMLLLSSLWLSLNAHSVTLTATPDSRLSQLASQLKPGDTLLLKPGVYRQTLELRGLRGRADAPIRITGEQAVLRASDVLRGLKPAGNGTYTARLAVEPSQVFIDGQPLRQIGGTVFDGYPHNAASPYHREMIKEGGIWPGRVPDAPPETMPPQSFRYDRERQLLTLKLSQEPGQRLIEVSQRTRTLDADQLSHVQLRGLTVEHANTSVTSRGASMVVAGEDLLLEQITANWNDLAGLQIKGERIVLRDSSANHNGQLGVAARGNRHLIQRVVAQHNNRRLFNKWWEAGGFKFIGDGQGGLRQSTVEELKALHNQGDGIWFDWKNRDVTLRRSLAAYNTGFGIHFEASGPGLIEHNVALGNGQRGIYLSSSRQTRVLHNLALGNGMQGIASVLENRKDDEGIPFKADGNRFQRNVIAWNQDGALFIPKDDGDRSDFNVFIGQGKGMYFSIDFPAMWRPAAWTLEDWNQASGQDRKSWLWHQPMPRAWQDYLAGQSTELKPLSALMRTVRQAPPADGTTVGAEHRALKLRLPIANAGPDWIP